MYIKIFCKASFGLDLYSSCKGMQDAVFYTLCRKKTGRILRDNSWKTEHHKSTQHAALATNHDFEDLLLVVYEGPTQLRVC